MGKSRYEQSGKSETKTEENSSISRKNGRACSRGRKSRSEQDLHKRGSRSSTALTVERKTSQGRNRGTEVNENRTKTKSRSRNSRSPKRQRPLERGTSRNEHRASIDKKKKQLGLEGDLRNRHLTKDLCEKLVEIVRWGTTEDKTLGVIGACEILQINSRAYYHWLKGNLTNQVGDGGQNKITPLEKKRIVAMAKKNPEWHCRKIAYQLEKKALAFVGKTTVAEVMKKHGLNHPFEQNIKLAMIVPGDMLLHEPWRKNLIPAGHTHFYGAICGLVSKL